MPSPVKVHRLHQKLIDLHRESGMTSKDLAAKSGYDYGNVRKIISKGKHCNFFELEDLLQVLGYSIHLEPINTEAVVDYHYAKAVVMPITN